MLLQHEPYTINRFRIPSIIDVYNIFLYGEQLYAMLSESAENFLFTPMFKYLVSPLLTFSQNYNIFHKVLPTAAD